MSQVSLGVDFGLSVTDAVLVRDGQVAEHSALHRPGPASVQVLGQVISALGVEADPNRVAVIGVTGGRSRELPPEYRDLPVSHHAETEAVGRGGLAVSGIRRALVVSCGTGTAMIAADSDRREFRHVSGTAVGGGTLEGLAARLIGLRNASEVSDLAEAGDAANVDTTLIDVLGAGVGNLPATATAVNLGALADAKDPSPADVAAGLVTMVGQTIALIALNVARATELTEVVFVGRLAEFPSVRTVLRSVFELYGAAPARFPDGAGHATAFGAALAATERD